MHPNRPDIEPIDAVEIIKRDSFFGYRFYTTNWISLIPWFAGVFYFFSLFVVIYSRLYLNPARWVLGLALSLTAAWFLIPPLWFICEYFFVMKRREPGNLPNVEAFKYTQDLASKFWIAGAAILGAILGPEEITKLLRFCITGN